PTGSGKATTLFAAMTEINRPEINVITVEDPVEYRLAGLNQVQINPRAGLTFATALRSIVRSDPDAIMVGEIRDVETAKISIESALTGHFVLSTLHTNDAPGAPTRPNEMGVEPFLTGAAVTRAPAQRRAPPRAAAWRDFGGDGHPLGRRPRKGPPWHDVDRRARPRHRLKRGRKERPKPGRARSVPARGFSHLGRGDVSL